MSKTNIKDFNRNRRCPIDNCGGIAIMQSHGKSTKTTWKCSKCGHSFGETQKALGDFS